MSVSYSMPVHQTNPYLIEFRVKGLFNHCCFVFGFLLYIWLQISVRKRQTEEQSDGYPKQAVEESDSRVGGTEIKTSRDKRSITASTVTHLFEDIGTKPFAF